MHYSKKTVGTSQKSIFAVASKLFMNLPMQLKKDTVTEAKLTDGILPAGTLITKDGKVATTTVTGEDSAKKATTDAYGILVNDVDFNNSIDGEELASICIFGFVNPAVVKFNNDPVGKAAELAAMTMIKEVEV